MDTLSKSQIVKYTLDCIIRVVGKRKSNLFAITNLAEIKTELEKKYDFLQYVNIDTKVFSETWVAVAVDQQLDFVEEKMIGQAFGEIIEKISRTFRSDEDYYIIREIRDELKYEIDTILKKFGVDLNLKQYEYTVIKNEFKKIEISRINNTEAIQPLLRVVVLLLHKLYPKEEAVETLSSHLKSLETKYDFLNFITIKYIPMEKEFYSFSLSSDINKIPPTEIGVAIEELLQKIGTSIRWDKESSFIESLQRGLGADDLDKIHEMGVKLEHINTQLKRQNQRDIAQKIIDTLFDLLAEREAQQTAINTLTTTITNLQKDYVALQYITIDTSKSEQGMNIFQVTPEINTVESYKIGKAFREMIKIINDIFGDKTFINDFKERLGEECLKDIEKMGVNFHFLELKFGW